MTTILKSLIEPTIVLAEITTDGADISQISGEIIIYAPW